jgi:hypothetical protein
MSVIPVIIIGNVFDWCLVGAIGAGKARVLVCNKPDYYNKLLCVVVYNIPADNNNQLVDGIGYYVHLNRDL